MSINPDIDPRQPRFRTTGPRHAPTGVILQCSSCEAVIRALKPTESVDITRGYYCDKCDTGTVIVNPAVEDHLKDLDRE